MNFILGGVVCRLPVLFALVLCNLMATVHAAEAPRIAIIIDDMGYVGSDGLRALELPGAVTFAFLPHTPHALAQAHLARRLNKEILLHVPMESKERLPLGPGALDSRMNADQVAAIVKQDLLSLPSVRGVNNHMGSKLTENSATMSWVMAAMRSRPGLFFVDSRTTSDTVAAQVAARMGVANVSRDVFLDPEPGEQIVRKQFAQLISVAKMYGAALAIGHPKPETLRVLHQELRRLKHHGVRLVPASDLINNPARDALHRYAIRDITSH